MLNSHKALALVLMLLGGCGEAGSYELSWAVGCAKGQQCQTCVAKSALECSRAGLDSIVVRVLRGSSEEANSSFPCFSTDDGAVGRGPGLDAGEVTLEVTGLSPGGQELTGPVSVSVEIGDSGLAPGCVSLPAPPACNDGVDNDGDGLVDMHDADCKDAKDTDEAK